MKMKIKLLLLVVLIISSMNASFATNVNVTENSIEASKIAIESLNYADLNDTYVLDVTYFVPVEIKSKTGGKDIEFLEKKSLDLVNSKSGITPMFIDPGVGTIKIVDVLHNESGFKTSLDKEFTSYDTFKYASVKILKYVPVVGDVFTIGVDIYNALRALDNDLVHINGSREVEITNRYTFREFYHRLYVWNSAGRWEDVGYSNSRYYYFSSNMYFYNTKIGEFDSSEARFTHSRGYKPAHIAEAANYMNKPRLVQLAYEAWMSNRDYIERY
ncbi:MAG: hypothetical protein ACLKAK_06840 [Alkaliphilus sp.]